MHSTATPLVDGIVMRRGWGVLETSRGVPYRWMVEPTAEIQLFVAAPWRTLQLFCSFVSWMPYDVLISASLADESLGRSEPATGVARAGRVGRHRQMVTLDRMLPAGAAKIGFEASRVWHEPGTERQLSLALTELRVVLLANERRLRHSRWAHAQG